MLLQFNQIFILSLCIKAQVVLRHARNSVNKEITNLKQTKKALYIVFFIIRALRLLFELNVSCDDVPILFRVKIKLSFLESLFYCLLGICDIIP